jgi:meso-butanediol dehydrogenase/(S,S)-butanediol dehydrogenase/diacetyl reductase
VTGSGPGAVIPLQGVRRFEGRVAVVTGAASGIGRATALRLASEGAAVACLDIDGAGAERTAAEAGAAGGSAWAYACDVSSAEQVTATTAQLLRDLGNCHVLCNVAGVLSVQRFEHLPLTEWQRTIDVNLTGPFLMCQALLPALIRTGGNVVNTGSRSGWNGRAYQAAYCVSKAGVHLLTKTLALEFAGRGVRVNAVVPGGTHTGFSAAYAAPPDADPALIAGLHSPLGIAEPEEVAAAIAFIASDEMRFMTGSIVPVDGGITA